MLQYAFEALNYTAVQFMIDGFNLASRNAIEKLGAKKI